MDKSTVKNVGGIGSLILVLSPLIGMIPIIGGLINLIGLIMVIYAVYGLSKVYKAPDVFKNYLIGIIIAIVGTVIAGIVGFASIFTVINSKGVSNLMFGMTSILSSLLIPLVILWIAGIIWGYFVRKAFREASDVAKNENFKWAGDLLLIGNVLLIILIGGLVAWIGLIFQTIVFFGLKE